MEAGLLRHGPPAFSSEGAAEVPDKGGEFVVVDFEEDEEFAGVDDAVENPCPERIAVDEEDEALAAVCGGDAVEGTRGARFKGENEAEAEVYAREVDFADILFDNDRHVVDANHRAADGEHDRDDVAGALIHRTGLKVEADGRAVASAVRLASRREI